MFVLAEVEKRVSTDAMREVVRFVTEFFAPR
jgi:hypothetical protein